VTPGIALLLVLSVSPALDAAKKHLAKGQFDEIAFDFEGQNIPDGEKADAARVLAQASKLALEAKDSVIALHCAQKALKLAPRDALALEAGARAAYAEQQFADAETYADGWILADPKSSAAHLLRAQLAAEAGEWDRVLDELKGKKFDGDDAARAAALEKKAKGEKAAQQQQETGARKPGRGSSLVVAAREPARAPVIVYGTSWCGWCKRTRDWLTQRKVDFVDKDVEEDRDAAAELHQKAADQGMDARGVPFVDVRGTLVRGFDPMAMERALHL
jgi:mycoredoxin